MNKELIRELNNRSSICEMCSSEENVTPFLVEGMSEDAAHSYALVCAQCEVQISEATSRDENHWRCLNESIWSEVLGVKILGWRILNAATDWSWSNDLLDMMYLEEEELTIAKSVLKEDTHFDSNGEPIYGGDTVTLIKDLDVKGSSMTAKRGTAVRNITLVHDNTNHIEGKVNGQRIVILTQYVKK